MRIGVFDSGAGGLTVLKELIVRQPFNEYIYFGDTIHMPYGDKSHDELFKYASKIIDFFIEQKVGAIVVACGTICSTIYDKLKEMCPVPIYSIIDVTMNYIRKKYYNHVLVMATSASVNNHLYRNKLASYGITVYEKACPRLVPLIESGSFEECDKAVSDYIDEIKFPVINALVLGCTHYPIIESQIAKHFSNNVDIINMGELFAESIKFKSGDSSRTLYFSLITKTLESNVEMILGKKYKIVSKSLM